MDFACIECGGNVNGIVKTNSTDDDNQQLVANGWYAWTEALGGEHMSIDFFFKLKSIPHIGEAFVRKMAGGKRYFHNLHYLNKFDVILITFRDYSLNDTLQFINQVRKIIKSDVILIGARSQPLGRFREVWRTSPNSYKTYRAILDSLDIVLEVNRRCLLYTSQMTKTHTYYIHPFYPTHLINTKNSNAKKDKTILVTGDKGRPDTIAGDIVAKKIQEDIPEITIKVPETEGRNWDILRNCHFEVIPRMPWENFISLLQNTYLVINWDIWWTLGRMPADAAMVGTPCIGANADLQNLLYPQLTFNDISGIESAINKGIALFHDTNLYSQMTTNARSKIGTCSYKTVKKEFLQMIDNYLRANNE